MRLSQLTINDRGDKSMFKPLSHLYLWLKSNPFVLFSIIMMLKIYMTWLVIYDVGLSWKPLVTGLPSIWVLFCLIE